ncbi:BTB/POZ domain-containing protein 6-like [Montipora capricornis]|uniref:BTB/POZ domain-containing protein 6-like n=1 Tax=Montipora capricornis TaxID=246305 RepID=UPI0035F128B9
MNYLRIFIPILLPAAGSNYSWRQCDMSSFTDITQENWQEIRPTIRERSSYLFNNELLSDVHFVAELSLNETDDFLEADPKKCKIAIPAHKLVLAIGSSVFYAMFYGEMAGESDTIVVSDCEYESLLELFRFLYSDEVHFTPDNVMQVLYLAKKYIVPALVDKCIEYLGDSLDGSNVFSVMECARHYDEKRLLERCWRAVDKHAEDAVKSTSFTTIGKSVLEELVERDTLKIEEVELFKAVDQWASKECEKQGLKTDGAVKRGILGEGIVKAIRFPVMKQKQFAAAVLDSNLLMPNEIYDLMKYFNSVELTSPLAFPVVERFGNVCHCFRFDSAVVRGFAHEYAALVFSVSKSIKLFGISLFGSENNQYTVELKIRETANPINELVCKTGTFSCVKMKSKSVHYSGFNVFFDKPVVIQRGTSHFVMAEISGPPSWCGGSGNHSVTCSDVTFTFKNAGEARNCTTIKVGQFPQFLFIPGK